MGLCVENRRPIQGHSSRSSQHPLHLLCVPIPKVVPCSMFELKENIAGDSMLSLQGEYKGQQYRDYISEAFLKSLAI